MLVRANVYKEGAIMLWVGGSRFRREETRSEAIVSRVTTKDVPIFHMKDRCAEEDRRQKKTE